MWKAIRRGPLLYPAPQVTATSAPVAAAAAAITSPALAPAATPPAPEGLTGDQRDRLAWALHHRWHGDHRQGDEAARLRCARLSGAYDDVAAIEPIILTLLNGARP